MSEANKISLPLNFNPTCADIKSENEDDEVQIVSTGALKKQLWPGNEENYEWSGEDIYSKFLIVLKNISFLL